MNHKNPIPPERDFQKYPHPHDEPPDVTEERMNRNVPHFPDARSKYYAELAERLRVSTQEGRPDWQIADSFTCLSVLANPDGFRFLAQKLLEMAEAAPGEELWLPVEPDGGEMGRKMFILRMAGEKPAPPAPPALPNSEEQLKSSRKTLAAKAGKAFFIPPTPEG